MTDVERLVLEGQKTILHGLRVLLWHNKLDNQALAVQETMNLIHDRLNEDVGRQK